MRLDLRVPTILNIRTPRPFVGRNALSLPPGSVAPKLRRAIMTGITGHTPGGFVNGYGNPLTDDWDVSTVQIAYWRKGSGWEAYKNKLVAEGYPLSEIVEANGAAGPTITFKGATALRFLSFFHVVVLIHMAPPLILQRIQNLSTVGTTFRFWDHSDRVYTGPAYSAYAQSTRQAALPFLLIGSAKDYPGSSPCDGDTTVDPEEPNPWPGGVVRCPANPSPNPGDVSGHSWMLDLRDGALGEAIGAEHALRYSTYWNAIPGLVSGFHMDNCSTQFLPGLATNAAAAGVTNAEWVRGVRTQVVRDQEAMAAFGLSDPFSGNVGDQSRTSDFPQITLQYWEHPFLKGDASGYWDVADTLEHMTALVGNGGGAFIGGRRMDTNPEANDIPQYEQADHPDLLAIALHAQSLGALSRFYLTFHATGDASNTTAFLYHGDVLPEVA